jgi:hypothetical protein
MGVKETKYLVVCYTLMRGPLSGLWQPTMREALRSFAARFIERRIDEKDILKLRLFDNHLTGGYNQNVLTNPYMRIALIEDGMGLEDPRTSPGIEYLHLKKGCEPPPGLIADGWKYTGSDPYWPKLYDLYSREKKT